MERVKAELESASNDPTVKQRRRSRGFKHHCGSGSNSDLESTNQSQTHSRANSREKSPYHNVDGIRQTLRDKHAQLQDDMDDDRSAPPPTANLNSLPPSRAANRLNHVAAATANILDDAMNQLVVQPALSSAPSTPITRRHVCHEEENLLILSNPSDDTLESVEAAFDGPHRDYRRTSRRSSQQLDESIPYSRNELTNPFHLPIDSISSALLTVDDNTDRLHPRCAAPPPTATGQRATGGLAVAPIVPSLNEIESLSISSPVVGNINNTKSPPADISHHSPSHPLTHPHAHILNFHHPLIVDGSLVDAPGLSIVANSKRRRSVVKLGGGLLPSLDPHTLRSHTLPGLDIDSLSASASASSGVRSQARSQASSGSATPIQPLRQRRHVQTLAPMEGRGDTHLPIIDQHSILDMSTLEHVSPDRSTCGLSALAQARLEQRRRSLPHANALGLNQLHTPQADGSPLHTTNHITNTHFHYPLHAVNSNRHLQPLPKVDFMVDPNANSSIDSGQSPPRPPHRPTTPYSSSLHSDSLSKRRSLPPIGLLAGINEKLSTELTQPQ